MSNVRNSDLAVNTDHFLRYLVVISDKSALGFDDMLLYHSVGGISARKFCRC